MTDAPMIRPAKHRATTPRRQLAAVALGVVIVLAVAIPAPAALYHVTVLVDGDDGTCDAHCTLREALSLANGNPGLDYIVVPAGVLAPWSSAGSFEISDTVFISGQGQEVTIIDAGYLEDSAFEISTPDATVWIGGLTITGAVTDYGAGIWLQYGHLSLSDVALRDNSAAGAGGGIYSYPYGTVTVKDGSVITRNSAGLWGGGLYGSVVTITDSIVSDNTAGEGGGLWVLGSLSINSSTICGNAAVDGGVGGAMVVGGSSAVISNSTIVGNHAEGEGGALVVRHNPALTLELDATTVSGNSSVTGASIYSSGSSIVFSNSLISGSCHASGSSILSSQGGNLESPGNTCELFPGVDLVSVADPMLWPLSHNGGPTPTMLPRPGSPALGNGNDFYCFTEDQRGELRSDGFCDIGAVERQAIEIDPIFVDGFESGTTSAWE